jgi:hypothetical protein
MPKKKPEATDQPPKEIVKKVHEEAMESYKIEYAMV